MPEDNEAQLQDVIELLKSINERLQRIEKQLGPRTIAVSPNFTISPDGLSSIITQDENGVHIDYGVFRENRGKA